MKKLFLIRHAKSDWSVPGLADIDRPLNNRGYGDAHRMGAHLKKLELKSTVMITSPAIRALSTAMIIAREMGFPFDNFVIHPELYHAEVLDYKDIIRSIDDKYNTAFMYGHNPVISEVISNLSANEVGEVSTCAVYILKFEVNTWETATSVKATIEQNLTPKQLSEHSH